MPKVMIEMEIPKSCVECRFCIYVNSGISLHCKVKQKEIPLKKDARSTECPLQEVREEENIIENETGGMTMAELKACPFCGGKANYYCEEIDWADRGYISAAKYYDTYVECEKCEARTASFDTEQQAIDAWNKRSASMTLSKQEKKIFLEGLSCKNCTEKKRCEEQKNAKKKLLDYFFATIIEANCFDERFIQEFKNAIPNITRCDVAYEKILEKLKEESKC